MLQHIDSHHPFIQVHKYVDSYINFFACFRNVPRFQVLHGLDIRTGEKLYFPTLT